MDLCLLGFVLRFLLFNVLLAYLDLDFGLGLGLGNFLFFLVLFLLFFLLLLRFFFMMYLLTNFLYFLRYFVFFLGFEFGKKMSAKPADGLMGLKTEITQKMEQEAQSAVSAKGVLAPTVPVLEKKLP